MSMLTTLPWYFRLRHGIKAEYLLKPWLAPVTGAAAYGTLGALTGVSDVPEEHRLKARMIGALLGAAGGAFAGHMAGKALRRFNTPADIAERARSHKTLSRTFDAADQATQDLINKWELSGKRLGVDFNTAALGGFGLTGTTLLDTGAKAVLRADKE